MKEDKYLAIYSDLIVREFADKDIKSSDVIGVIKFSLTGRGFKPNYFSKYRQGDTAYYYEFEFENSILLNEYFKLTSISESYHDGKNIYWKEATIDIEDISGEIKKFNFLYKPNHHFPYKELQKRLFEIVESIGSFKTFEAIDLAKSLDQDNDNKGPQTIAVL